MLVVFNKRRGKILDNTEKHEKIREKRLTEIQGKWYKEGVQKKRFTYITFHIGAG